MSSLFSQCSWGACPPRLIIAAERETLPPPPSSSHDDSKPADNTGTLILDATCTPADVHFPTDAGVRNDARELSEKIIDELCVDDDCQKKPRTYRRLARKNYLLLVRNKRPGYSLIRRTLRAQLQYLRRNLGHIQDLTKTNGLTAKQQYKLDVLTEVYRQQKQMYDNNRHAIEKRIVSVSQPWVRPIVRGKLTAKTEFGAKLALSLENGFDRVENLSWDAFNESQTLIESCKRYRERNGVYPKRILADKIYRNLDNLNFCNQNGIKMYGPKLGRPPKDKSLYEYQKLMERSEAGERNAIEGKFGEAKRRYG